MKSKISLFNKAIFKRSIRGNLGLWLGLLAVYLFILPLNLYLVMNSRWMTSDMSAGDLRELRINQMITGIWSMDLFVLLFACSAVIVAVVVFSYLFTGRNTNMMHTFPVTRAGLFCTNYVTGVLYLVVPQVAAAMLSLLVGASMGAVDGQVVKYYFLWIGAAAAETVFFFSMAVCVLMFAGNAAAAVVFYFILNFLYEGCCLILSGILSTVCYGLDRIDRVGSLDVLTPIQYMRRRIIVVDSGVGDKWVYQFHGGKILAGYLAVAVVLAAIAFLVYQKKQLETAGDVITVGWLKPIFRWGAAACCSALGTVMLCSQFGIEPTIGRVLITATFFSIISFFVAQMVLERSMRVFTKQRVWEGIAFVVCICAVYLGMDNDLFGIEKKIPKADEIQAVIMDGEVGLYAYTPDEIAWVREIHKQIVDSKKEFEQAKRNGENGPVEEWDYANFTYLLKNGSQVRRNYFIPVQKQAQSVSTQIADYKKQPDVILKSYFGIHYPDIEVYGATLDTGLGSHRVSQKDAKKLYKAVVQDAKEGHFSEQQEDDGGYYDNKDINTSGVVTFDVRDEQGFIAVTQYKMEGMTEVSVDIWLDASKKCLIDTIKEMGYLEK